MRLFLFEIWFENRKWEFLVVVELLLGDLFLANSRKAIKWQDINSLFGGSVLWIIISVTGTCDGKISRVKVSETLEKSPKTPTFELYFASFIHLECKANRICHLCVVSVFIYYNSGILRFADRQIFCIVS